MKMIYFECNAGAAGDMLLSALLELHPKPEDILAKLNQIGLPGVVVQRQTLVRCGISGTGVSVQINGCSEEQSGAGDRTGSSLSAIFDLLERSKLPQAVLEDAKGVYHLLAEAESAVHGVPVEQVHFHEVGMLDAVVDIVGVSLLLHELAPERIVVSPINVGSGQVRCTHGVLPVPAPAVLRLLEGVPIYSGELREECCTPTGAALLRYFADDFGALPLMRVEKVGYGMGKKNFPTANCVRAIFGEAAAEQETILELCCNLDDMTPEAVGFALETLLSAGALDVFTTPIGMKKSRPGVLLTCLCRPAQKEQMVRLLFCHTTTLGVRIRHCDRYMLERTETQRETPYGTVHLKRGSGWGVTRSKAEYEDLAKIARENHLSLQEVKRILDKETVRMEESWEPF